MPITAEQRTQVMIEARERATQRVAQWLARNKCVHNRIERAIDGYDEHHQPGVYGERHTYVEHGHDLDHDYGNPTQTISYDYEEESHGQECVLALSALLVLEEGRGSRTLTATHDGGVHVCVQARN